MYTIEENNLIKTEQQWHEQRINGIGGSSASAVIGHNPYQTNVELWEYKTGKKQPEDISNKDCVIRGNLEEEPMRVLFSVEYPEYDLLYKPYDLRRHKKYNFLYATLDGEMKDINNRIGVYEGKTTEILQSMQREKWDKQIPQNYFCQVLHNMFVIEADFAFLNARLITRWTDNETDIKEVRATEKRYKIERSDVQESINYLIEKEVEFWEKYVLADVCPPLLLPSL